MEKCHEIWGVGDSEGGTQQKKCSELNPYNAVTQFASWLAYDLSCRAMGDPVITWGDEYVWPEPLPGEDVVFQWTDQIINDFHVLQQYITDPLGTINEQIDKAFDTAWSQCENDNEKRQLLENLLKGNNKLINDMEKGLWKSLIPPLIIIAIFVIGGWIIPIILNYSPNITKAFQRLGVV